MTRPRPQTRKGPQTPALLAVLGAVVLLAVGAAVLTFSYGDRVLPGTSVAGVDLGGADAAEARRRLASVLRDDTPLELRAPGETLRVRPSEAGRTVDLDATVERALDAGRDGVLGTLRGVAGGLVTTRDVAPAARIDGARLGAATTRIAREVDRPVAVGAIRASPDSLQVAVTSPRDGRTVNQSLLAARLRARLESASRSPVTVPVRERQAVSGGRVREIGREAEAYLLQPLRLDAPGGAITVSPARLAPLLELQPLDEGRRARLGVDRDALGGLVAQIAEQRDRPARNARLVAPATAVVVVDGKGGVSWRPRKASVSVTGEARAGREVRRPRAAERIAMAVRRGEHAVTLPVATVAPSVTADQAAGVDRLIGTFTTAYEPGQPRVANIQRIAAAVDGTVIAPGATFSLNEVAGERTAAKGYVEAPFIADGKIVPSIGGGVSQFSTTMYNAAYFAGLKLDAHRAHSLYIARYPPGRESTLNFPDIDLKWTNDTDTPVLVRTNAAETTLSVSLYGDNDERRVTATAGDRVPVEGADFAITVTRTVRYADGRTVRQPVTTRYENPVEDE